MHIIKNINAKKDNILSTKSRFFLDFCDMIDPKNGILERMAMANKHPPDIMPETVANISFIFNFLV